MRGTARAANRQLGQFGISAFGHTELSAMICLSGHQTIASQCTISHNAQSNLPISRQCSAILKLHGEPCLA